MEKKNNWPMQHHESLKGFDQPMITYPSLRQERRINIIIIQTKRTTHYFNE